MPDFYFNQFSISAFSQFLLSTLIAVFFLISRKRHTRGWYRLLFFLLISSFFLTGFLASSLLDFWAKFLIPIRYVLLGGAILLFNQYAYHYPRLHFSREMKGMGITGSIILVVFATVLTLRMLTHQYYIPEEQIAYNLLILTGFAWAIVLLIRQAMVPLTDKSPLGFWSVAWLKRLLRTGFKSLAGGRDDSLEPFRDLLLLAGIVLLGSVPTLLNVLFHASLISEQTNLYFSNAAWLLFLFAFILAYFKLSPEPSTISRKIIVVSMVTILVVLSTVGSATMSKLSEIYDFTRRAPDMKTIDLFPLVNGGYRISTGPPVWKTPGESRLTLGDADADTVNLPFSFPFFGKSYRQIWVSANGLVSFTEAIRSYLVFEFYRPTPKLAVLFKDLNPEQGGSILLHQSDSLVSVTWLGVPDFGRRTSNSFQVSLFPDGRIRMSYIGLSPVLPGYIGADPGSGEDRFPVNFNSGVSVTTPAGRAFFEDYYQEHRNYIHQGSSVFIVMIVASTLLVILVFPSFFRLTVVRPIRILLHGVRQVNAGNLEVRVPVREDDEIGYLTRSFNQMIESVRKAKEEEVLLLQKEKEEQLLQMDLRRKSDELEFARRLQFDMLPESLAIHPSVLIDAGMRTAAEVGGDYYDVIHIDKNRWCLAVGDATGHGVGAGLVVGMLKMALINSIRSYNIDLPMEKLVKNLNLALRESIRNRGIGMGLTLMVLDLDRNRMEICSTGMPFPFYYNAKKDTFTVLELTGPPLGMIPDFTLSTLSIQLNPGDVVIATSDGFTERTNPDDVMWFEEKRFDHAAERITRTWLQPAMITRSMFDACDSFAAGRDHDDDMTVFVLRYLGKLD